MEASQSEKRVALFPIVNTCGDRCQTESAGDADRSPTYFQGNPVIA
jgi:hypothetical protein